MSVPLEQATASVSTPELQLLRALLTGEGVCLEPVPDARAPLAYCVPRVDALLGLSPGAGLEVLERLADQGLLRRELHNQVPLCTSCRSWKLNYREVCPHCRDIDLRIEPLIQHFRCAHVGLDSEFRLGTQLCCPRCSGSLNAVGQDYSRPGDTWICNACDGRFAEPSIEVQCRDCGEQCPASEAAPADVYRYLSAGA